MFNEIADLLRGNADTFAAAQRVERDAAVIGYLAVAKRTAELINDLYWKAKDVRAATWLGQLGLHYCLTHASGITSEEASGLRLAAKEMAFNIGSYAWPGWAEPGITITEPVLGIGRDASRLNLRLAMELNRPAKGKSNAHWLIGAYAIVDRQTADAVAHFEQAAAFSEEANDPAAAMMNRTYACLARLAADATSADCAASLENALSVLQVSGLEDAKFYAGQIRTAHKVFVS